MNTNQSMFVVSEDVKKLFPEEKLASLVQTFTQLDANQDGRIELDEYLDFALTQEKTRLTKKFTAADTNKDGGVEFAEFVAVIEPYFQILKKFHELDLDQNGLLSLEEALNIADRLVLPLSTTQLQAIMHEVDRDRDGQITYYEYLGAIAHLGFQ